MSAVAPSKRANWHDAYDAQMALWRFYRTPLGQRYLRDCYRGDANGLQADTREMLLRLYQAEEGRLLDCDPIYVSAEMCEVVDAAKDTFSPEALIETDLLTPRGFLLFERPFIVPDRYDNPTTVKALSWVRMFSVEDEGEETRMEEILAGLRAADKHVEAEELEDSLRKQGVKVQGVAITVYAENDQPFPGAPPVLPLHLTPWHFDMSFDGNEWDEIGRPTGAEWWWRIAQTTFRLMQQKISARYFHRPDRATRRTAKALRFPDEREVVVVRLRREEGEHHEPSSEGANYSHRFIVSGHWRNQWYPSISAHRQIWISPFVKGDPGLPLIVRPRRAFQWAR